MFDHERLAGAVREILIAIGEDPDAPALRETPERAASMFAEFFAGIGLDPIEVLKEPLPHEHEEAITLKNIEIRSMCEHHLVPMIGYAHIAYIPNGRIVGFDRLVRAVDALARRPQLQERLTTEIAAVIEKGLDPSGVAVMLELEQMCMTMRGVRQTESRVITTAYRGTFERDPESRTGFRSAIRS